jgi:hypothetical protein
VDLSKEIDDEMLKTAVEEGGYEVSSIYIKKGLFS